MEYGIPREEQEVAARSIPPILYVPCAKTRNRKEVEVLLAQHDDGTAGVFAYTSLDRFYRCLGDRAWTVIAARDITKIEAAQQITRVYFDEVPDEMKGR